MNFTADWFDRHTKPHWEQHVKPLGPFWSYCEIGVHEGRSLVWTAENLMAPDGICVGIDPYLPKRHKNAAETAAVADRCAANVAEARREGRRIVVVKGRSQDTLMEWCLGGDNKTAPPPFDFVYVDGEHWAHAAILDLCLAWRLLQPGGVLVVDDVHRIVHRAKPLVRMAVDAFESCFETQYHELYRVSRQRGYVKL